MRWSYFSLALSHRYSLHRWKLYFPEGALPIHNRSPMIVIVRFLLYYSRSIYTCIIVIIYAGLNNILIRWTRLRVTVFITSKTLIRYNETNKMCFHLWVRSILSCFTWSNCPYHSDLRLWHWSYEFVGDDIRTRKQCTPQLFILLTEYVDHGALLWADVTWLF